MSSILSALRVTAYYWLALYEWIFSKKGYSQGSYFKDDTRALVQVYSLSLIFSMWYKPHYRCKSFQQDMIDNLKNVAVPGTGVPLSVFCYNWWMCLFVVAFINPIVCLMGAINKVRNDDWKFGPGLSILFKHYEEHLLHPNDWFSFWRLNCRLVSHHSNTLKPRGYQLEDKWSFLQQGAAMGLPVSPFMSLPVNVVVKNKNIEGGMGIYFYKNALHGGDWIFQEKLENAPWLDKLLPSPAPLSTMRVITSSTWTLAKHGHKVTQSEFKCFDDARSSSSSSSASSSASSLRTLVAGKEDPSKYVKALSSLLRLGRAGAATDHTSVLFDVDIATGKIKPGCSNQHWYKLGPQAIWTCPWLPQGDGFTEHPDTPDKAPVAGQSLPPGVMQQALDIVIKSHYDMLPDVPMVGWDVAFCSEGIYLLEVNLSCNFFRGAFDVPAYICFVDEHFRDLEKRDA